MSRDWGRVPVALRIAVRLLPEDARDEVMGDLLEVWRERRRTRSRLVCALWLARQPWAAMRSRRESRSPMASSRTGGAGRGRTATLSAGWRPAFSWLDVRLGVRMLGKQPILTVVAGLTLALGIPASLMPTHVLALLENASFPVEDGQQIVGIRNWDLETDRAVARPLHNLAVWREELRSFETIGAGRSDPYNVHSPDGNAAEVRGAEVTASVFEMLRVPPFMGRTLLDADEVEGAEPVTVVGIMPEGFAFPVVHDAWLPLRLGNAPWQTRPRQGPELAVFGRLAPGWDKGEARAQLEALAVTAAAESPETHEHLSPQIRTYAHQALGLPGSISPAVVTAWAVSVNLPALLFVLLVCGNVGLLLFARAAIREGEMVVRNALGAGRARILLQLFVEALLLAGVAAVLGLSLARYALGWWLHIVEVALLESPLPFWFDAALSPATIAYSVALTVVAAGVAGVVPGLRVTRALPTRLQQASAGCGDLQVSGLWTAVIVCQIALTVVAPVVAVGVHLDSLDERGEVVLPLEEDDFLAARLALDETHAPVLGGGEEAVDDFGARYRERLETLEGLLAADPRVTGVTFAERLPRMYHPWRQIEVDGPAAEPRDERGHRVASTSVAVDFFDVLGTEIVVGRVFDDGDLGADVGAVVVNESFVESVLGGRNPLGRRIRYVATEEYRSPDQEPGPWMEIIGVVEDLGTTSGYGPMGMYHPASPGEASATHVAIHLDGGADDFGPALRAAGFQVDADLRISDIQTFSEIVDSERAFYRFWTAVAGGTAVIVLILSLGGIYSVMAFTVARRTREIGIRVALGSSARRIIADILRKPLTQVALGLGGGGLLLLGPIAAGKALFDPRVVAMFFGYMLLMTVVCLTAAIVPTLRALAVEPADALRGES